MSVILPVQPYKQSMFPSPIRRLPLPTVAEEHLLPGATSPLHET